MAWQVPSTLSAFLCLCVRSSVAAETQTPTGFYFPAQGSLPEAGRSQHFVLGPCLRLCQVAPSLLLRIPQTLTSYVSVCGEASVHGQVLPLTGLFAPPLCPPEAEDNCGCACPCASLCSGCVWFGPCRQSGWMRSHGCRPGSVSGVRSAERTRIFSHLLSPSAWRCSRAGGGGRLSRSR